MIDPVGRILEPRPIIEPPVDPTVDDLQEWVRRGFEKAYAKRPRDRAGREDIAYGWIECLLYLRAYGSFKPRAEAS